MRFLRTSSRRAATSAVLVAALLSTAACGGGGGDDGDGGGEAPGFNAAIGNVANPSDKKGGTLKFIANQDADSWDPTVGYYGFAWNFMRYYTRQLVTPAAAPGEKSNELVPDLAKGLAEVSNGGKTYTYHLKDDIKWQDGKPVTSMDIKYGIQRQWAMEVLPGGPKYIKTTMDPEGEYKGPYKDDDGFDRIKTPDPKTIVFELPKPNSDFEEMLAMPSASPVRKDKDTKGKYGLKPFSNGPYKWETYDPNQKIVLVRNEHWERSTDTVRKALPDKVTVDIVSNANELDKRLISGKYDLHLNNTGLQPAGRAEAMRNHKANVDNPTLGYIRYAVFATHVKPLDNIHCRKAIIYAADMKSIQTARGGPMAGGDIGTNMLPPMVPGSDKSYDPYGLAKNPGEPATDKAKAELKKCGKPNGFSTKVAVRNTYPVEVDTAEALQQSLGKVGIKVEIEQFDGAQTSGKVGNPDLVKRKGWGISILGWGPDFPTVQGYGKPLWHSDFIFENGNFNYAMIDDPKIDAAFAEYAKTQDEAKKAEIAASINQMVMEGAYYLPFVFEKVLVFRSDRVTNVYSSYAYSGQYDFASIGVK